MKDIQLLGSFKITQWNEEKVINSVSFARVEYNFEVPQPFVGLSTYSIFYKYYSESEPLKSESIYTGFLQISTMLQGEQVDLCFKEEGDFVMGVAKSKLILINNDNYTGDGHYEASHDKSTFCITIKKK